MNAIRIKPAAAPPLLVLLILVPLLLAFALGASAGCAYASGISLDSSGTSAAISAPTSVRYKTSKTGNALWNHGTFYVYFFEGTKSVRTSMVREASSDIDTMGAKVSFTDGVSWAKVHVAAISSSTSGNGGKNARLKDPSGKNLFYEQYLNASRQFYVWISDAGGSGGKISLRGTAKTTVYADGKTFKNIDAITVGSQHGASHYDMGATESPYYDVLNIPFKWTGKTADQVPYRAISSRGLGNNDDYHSFYRLSWRQYSNGTTYSGYSPYKLQHGVSNALNIWTSVNLASVGVSLAPSYRDETLSTLTGYRFRNKDSFLACCLRMPKEQLKIDANGGTLTSRSKTYSGKADNFKKDMCGAKVTLPTSGFKVGKDGLKNGYKLIGYSWSSGTNRRKASSTSPKTSKPFVSFDQATPAKVDIDDPTVKLCNYWQLPAFGEGNMSFSDGGFLKTPTVANVTYKAQWEALPFKIHYFANGLSAGTTTVTYDSAYKLKNPPNGSSGWVAKKQDGAPAPSSGSMPAQDIYAYADTEGPSAIKYYIDGELVSTYKIPFGNDPLITTYVDKTAGGNEFNDDGTWDVDSASFSATYKRHYNSPDQVQCKHYVDTSYYVEGHTVESGYYVITDTGERKWVDDSYWVPGYWVDQGYYVHHYDEETNYSYYTTKTYSTRYTAPVNYHGGTWHGWFTDPECKSKAASSYSFRQGDALSFYSYTDHKVAYIINGRTALEETKRYREMVNPYTRDDAINEYGGELKRWYSDPDYLNKVDGSISVGTEDLLFYGYTEHNIHFWMDAGTKIDDNDNFDGDKADDGEDVDDGKTDRTPEESSYCRHEMTARYGETFSLPTTRAVSDKVTRAGCEDWLETNKTWYSDSDCTNRVTSATCNGDMTFYSYNNVKLTYGLSNYAEELETKQSLLDSKGAKIQLSSFLPQPKLYRYGSTVNVEGNGSAHWITSAGLTRSAKSLKGGFLDKEASGKASKTLLLQSSLTVYKQWAQGLFDGVTAS